MTTSKNLIHNQIELAVYVLEYTTLQRRLLQIVVISVAFLCCMFGWYVTYIPGELPLWKSFIPPGFVFFVLFIIAYRFDWSYIDRFEPITKYRSFEKKNDFVMNLVLNILPYYSEAKIEHEDIESITHYLKRTKNHPASSKSRKLIYSELWWGLEYYTEKMKKSEQGGDGDAEESI